MRVAYNSISADQIAAIAACAARGMNKTDTAAELGINRGTVHKHWPSQPAAPSVPTAVPRLPDPVPEAGGPSLPEPVDVKYEPFVANDPARWLCIGDLHLPYHSPEAIKAAVDDGKRIGATGVLINGDMLDFYGLSNHYREPNKVRVKEEIEKGREFLRWLRSQFPHARILYKLGNHCERLRRYLAERAPEIFDLEDLHLHKLLRTENEGVEVIEDKRVVMLGKLAVIHGHEYRGGGGVQPSRWLYLRTGDSTLTNHFHRVDHYTFRTIGGREIGMWAVGCLCHMAPDYMPLNQWGAGWATIEVSAGGMFTVTNRQRLQSGRVI